VHGEQEGKASYSGAVATFLELELGCGQPDSHSNYGFQDLDRLNYQLKRVLTDFPTHWSSRRALAGIAAPYGSALWRG
jgi:hypothetical protein